MVTRLKTKDLPQPWNSSKKTLAGMEGLKSSQSQVSPSGNSSGCNVQVERKKRGRPSGKSALKEVVAPKSMKKTRSLPPSAVEVLLSVSQMSVADVDELRRKRKEDAAACGRAIRTVSPVSGSKIIPSVVTLSTNEDHRNNDVETGEIEALVSIPQSSRIVPVTGPTSGEKNRASALKKQASDECEPTFCRRPGKEPVEDYADEGIPSSKCLEEFRGLEREHVDVESVSHDNNERQHRGDRGRSPTTKYSRQVYESTRRGEFGDGYAEGPRTYQEPSDQSLSRSPRRNEYKSSRCFESWSPRRNHSRSSMRQSWRHRNNVGHEDDEYGYGNRHREEYHNPDGLYMEDHRHHRQYESWSPENSGRRRRSRSSELICGNQQRNWTVYSGMSRPRRSLSYRDVMVKERLDFGEVKKDDILETSEASERRRRRNEQKFVDSMKAKRQKEGKTPFFLMLDREGKPYGPGRPSWLAEVNKLAQWLDPSCTHIRKQTFEDVQTFKDRLDENFEYSGALNEDYLRALMGKAVTKKRTELITFIKNGGKQPKHMDEEVWKRLEKLATSEQREQKSEQGRHANACRRVIGRTGRRGLDGVRAKLRSFLGRSPDPSEVEEEMHRDKGYGGRTRKNNSLLVKEESNSAEVILVDEDMQCRRSSSKSHGLHSDVGNKEVINYHAMPLDEGTRRHQKVHEEVDGARASLEKKRDNFIDTGSTEMTKDEFIEKLKAEIELLQRERVKMSTSNEEVI